jgi:ectoine hydroxylase-related dioxygenase (phytanoyl-CoA dioxygenase family)
MIQLPPDNEAALQQLWTECCSAGPKTKSPHPNRYDYHHHLFYHGRNKEETLAYLFYTQPDYETFRQWLGDHPLDVDAIYRQENRILSDEDLANWHRDGYIVVKDIVPRSQCEAANTAIWDYLDATPEDPATWYKEHPGKNGMMLRLVHHPALDANRFSSRIRQVFEELYGHKNLYQPIDKVSFNAPETGTHRFIGSPLHWDVSVATPIPYSAQGLLYLTDTSASDGAFNCVPGFHHIATEWLSETGIGVNPRERAIKELKPVAVPGNAGDLVIWLQALPHCATPNKGTMPRMVQYISWRPKDIKEADVWI